MKQTAYDTCCSSNRHGQRDVGPLPQGRALKLAVQVEASDGESARPRRFRVTIKYAALVNIQALVDFVRYIPSCSNLPDPAALP